MIIKIFGPVHNLMGKWGNYGHCAHCRRTWNWVYGVRIPFYFSPLKVRTITVICAECFEKLSSVEIIQYCYQILDKWQVDASDPEESWGQFKANVCSYVPQMKGESG